MNGIRRKHVLVGAGLVAGLAWVVAALRAGDSAPVDLGPEVVMLRSLENLYEAVPFEHKTHAKMAQMWDGCVTCHHRNPHPSTKHAEPSPQRSQEATAEYPACKSCHPAGGENADMRMPNLKGAYHRQCLNCHREWAHANNCVACHKPKGERETHAADPSPDDIMGRMHPPIPEPEMTQYKTRFTPADGNNVLFRHKEHTTAYGLRCAHCHHRDNCSNCHDAKTRTILQKPVRPGKTWRDSHGPCLTCHQDQRCRHCHYKDDQQPPPPFEHKHTGQVLDEEHVKLACLSCHVDQRSRKDPTCGGSECHEKDKTIAYPAQRPGPVVTTQPVRAVRTELSVKPGQAGGGQ